MPRLAGADAGRPADGARRVARLRRRLSELLPGRRGDRSLSGHGAQTSLGAPPCAPARLLSCTRAATRAPGCVSTWKRDSSADGATLPRGNAAADPRPTTRRRSSIPPTSHDTSSSRKRPEVFETMHDGDASMPSTIASAFYTWSDRECCLPEGRDARDAAGSSRCIDAAPARCCMPGDVLIFEEILSPTTGSRGDADPARRCAVRLTPAPAGRRSADRYTGRRDRMGR